MSAQCFKDRDGYWGNVCVSMAARCIECSSLGMRGDPMGILRVNSTSQSDCFSDLTHEAEVSEKSSDREEKQSNREVMSPEINQNPLGPQAPATAEPRVPSRKSMGSDLNHAFKHFTLRNITNDPVLLPRLALMIMLSILVALLSGLIWYVTKQYAHKSLGPVTSSLRKELLLAVEYKFQEALAYNNASAVGLSRLFMSSRSLGNTTSWSEIQPLLWLGYMMRTGSAFIGFLRSNGLLEAYSSLYNTSIISSNSSNLVDSIEWRAISQLQPCLAPSWYGWYYQQVDTDTGQSTTGPIPIGCPLFSTNLSLFETTINDSSGSIHWDIFINNDGPLLLAMQAIKTSNFSSPLGVTFTSVSLNSIFSNIDLMGGDVFIIKTGGELVTQTGASYLNHEAPYRSTMMPRASESNNNVVAQAANLLSEKFDNFSDLGLHPFVMDDVVINGDLYYINSSPLKGSNGLIAVLVIPRKSFLAEFDRRTHAIRIIFIALALSILFLGCLFICILTRGVSLSMKVEQSYIAQVKATKMVERRSNHKNLFIANMSHDLRTPLAAIIGLIDLCLSHKEQITTELEANMVQMKTCATTLLGILNSILDMSRAEVGKLELEITDFDLIKVLEEVVDIFAVVGLKKGIEVMLELPDDEIETVRWVRGDAGRLKQVLSNLLSNGVKFTSNGYVVLRAWPRFPIQPRLSGSGRKSGRWFQKVVQAAPLSWAKNKDELRSSGRRSFTQGLELVEFEFEVDDTGQGIPPARREAVFRNFVQGNSKVHCTHGGTGLGLAIVRSLVHMMGGQIKVINKEGPGTLFKFNLNFERSPKGILIKPEKGSKDANNTIPRGIRQCWPINTPTNQILAEESPLRMNVSEDSWQCQSMQVVLAVHGDLEKRSIINWMRKRCVQALEVSSWQSILPTLERLVLDTTKDYSYQPVVDTEGQGRRSMQVQVSQCVAMIDSALIPEDGGTTSKFRSDLDTLRRKARGLGFYIHVTWIFSANTSNVVWQTLHGRSDLILNKPAYGSRLNALFEELQARYMKYFMPEEGQGLLSRNSSQASNQEIQRRSVSNPKVSGVVSFSLVDSSIQLHAGKPQVVSNGNQNGEQERHESGSCSVDIKLRQKADVQKKTNVDIDFGRQEKRAGSLAGLKLLVVEDTPLLQKVTCAMLEKEGAIVKVVSNGKEAVQAVASTIVSEGANDLQEECTKISDQGLKGRAGFDLVLMDCQMPVMDGYTATIKIRELEGERHMPIVALTAHAMASDEKKCVASGMDAYLTKPLKLDALLKVIEKLGIQTK